MKSTEDILAIIEEAFLNVNFETRFEQTKLLCGADNWKLMRVALCDELLNKCKPLIEEYLEEHYVCIRKRLDSPVRPD